MSRMTTSLASLSWARAAIRRAWSSEVSQISCRETGTSLASVQVFAGDRGRDRGRNEAVDRFPARRQLPDLARGHGQRLDLEEPHAVGWGLRQFVTGPCRHAETR